MNSIEITEATAAQYPRILELNEGAVPHVNSIPLATLQHLHGQSVALLVARAGDEIAGFVLALHEFSSYQSMNFQYFKRRYPEFAYVDRIVVNPDFRRSGIGARLYGALIDTLNKPVLTCEVNVKPPNPGSYGFHQRLGFTEVDQQDTEGGAKRVALLALPLSAARAGGPR
jgi:predicted GNAT superfamily acetyltransferase